MNKLFPFVHCPKDNGFFINKSELGIQCDKCSQSFPIKDDIIVFLDDTKLEEVDKKQKVFYESYYEKRSLFKKDRHQSILNKIWANIRQYYSKGKSIDNLTNFFYSQLGTFSKKKILEIGCGSGTPGTDYCLLNKNELDYYVGIDMAISPLIKLRRKIKEANVSNFYLINTSVFDDYLVNNQFDLIIGRGILHHFDSPNKIAEKIHKLLAPNGKIVFLEPLNTNVFIKILRIITRPFRPNLIWEHPFTRKDLNKFLKVFHSNTLHYFDGVSVLSLLFFFNSKLFNLSYKFLYNIDKFFSKYSLYNKIFLRVVIIAKK